MIKLYTDTQIIFLPAAEWGDFERVESTVQLKRSMNNEVKVTHVHKLPNFKTTQLTLKMTRIKSIEFLEFYKIHGADKMTLEIPNLDPKIGYLKINPMELEKLQRGEVDCQIEFSTTE